ncbi:MAG: tRNA (N6-isopentenyl adenosine(37)-C2)-methylthiotransferase MiaB [Spirochaetales bacterium]|nr:tRNA (N6-isopentenyl adenosine(37)-C2)-methylthiotransferase MiaB [Spirochaetales bacterium]
MHSFYIETYGCQMNTAESAALRKELCELGMDEAITPQEADLVILNTCSVRKTAEDRIFGRLGYYRHLKHDKPLKLAVLGCMAERLADNLQESNPDIDYLIGTFGKKEFLAALQEHCPHAPEQTGLFMGDRRNYRFFLNHDDRKSVRGFVPVMHGCNNFCSYCIVPHVRGRETSRPPAEITSEVRRMVESGKRDITLLGQNVNSYTFSMKSGTVDFPALLEMVLEEVDDDFRLRFITSHPKDLSPRLVQVMRNDNRCARHIHLPVQHGSNTVLEAMNRGYTVEKYRSTVDMIKESIPEISLSTDIMVGFPGEKPDDIDTLLQLMEYVGFEDAFTYIYNPREGTAAYSLGDPISREEKVTRLQKVIALQEKLTGKERRKRLGQTARVLVEGTSRRNENELMGSIETDAMVVFPSEPDRIGNFVEVELDEYRGSTYRGKELIPCRGE